MRELGQIDIVRSATCVGGALAVSDAIAGHIPLIIIGVGPLIPHVQSGVLRGYAVTANERFAMAAAVNQVERERP